MQSGVPYLPVQRSTGITNVLLRDMRQEEAIQTYWMLLRAARAGFGYSVSEICDFEEFKKNKLKDKIAFVMADPVTDAIIYAMLIVRDNKFVRHSKEFYLRGWAVVNPDYKLRAPDPGVFKVLYQATAWLGFHMGFRYFLASSTLNHRLVLRFLNKGTIQGTIVGIIPDGIYLEGNRWTDIFIYESVLTDNFNESDYAPYKEKNG